GRVEIVPERFFDHHAPPASILLVEKAGLAQLLNNWSEELGCRSQVEQAVGLRAVFLVHSGELCGQSCVCSRIPEFTALIVEPLGEPFPGLRAPVLGVQKTGYLVAKLVAA